MEIYLKHTQIIAWQILLKTSTMKKSKEDKGMFKNMPSLFGYQTLTRVQETEVL